MINKCNCRQKFHLILVNVNIKSNTFLQEYFYLFFITAGLLANHGNHGNHGISWNFELDQGKSGNFISFVTKSWKIMEIFSVNLNFFFSWFRSLNSSDQFKISILVLRTWLIYF